jgi:DNA-directed RNA polymerase subunit alpha
MAEVDPLIDLKMLLVEREDCDAGTVQKLREALAQGGTQFKVLREVNDQLRRKIETAPPSMAKKLHLKLGITNYFLGFMANSADHLKQVEVPLGFFYLGRALVNRQQYAEALGAFEKAEKAGYAAQQVSLQRAGVNRLMGNIPEARAILAKLVDLQSHSAEYHFQLAGCHLADGDRLLALRSYERASELDPGHTGALFQLAYFNDLAGNDEEAIGYYERCLKYPPVHKGVLNNLGVLYEDNERFDKARDCYERLIKADPQDERAKLFFRDANASLSMYYDPGEEEVNNNLRQILETPVSEFELSVRSRNCLKKMGIRSLGDLTRVTEASLLASKNFGETSLEEIKQIMTAKGLRVGQALDQGALYEPRPRPVQNLTPEEQAVLNKSVSELNLSVRARKCMNRLNIATLGDLVQRSAEELMEARNFGTTSLLEVREKLTGYGLKLRNDN